MRPIFAVDSPAAKRFLPLLALVLTLAGCSDMPLRDHLMPTATPDPAAIVARLQDPAFQIPYLGSSAGMWHASLALGNPGSQETFSSLMADSATRLAVDLTADQLARIETEEEAGLLVDALAAQMEETYGGRAKARFDVEYHTTAAAELLRTGPTLLAATELPVIRHEAGLHMLDALGAATRFGVELRTIQDGQNIALPLLSRADLEDGPAQIEAWRTAIDYAYRGEPTPVPPPSEADQAGTDITVALPPGNRLRGELLHEQLGCSACHITDAVAPQWRSFDGVQGPGLLAVADARWQDPNYTGGAKSAVEYLVESTVLPDVHVVDPYEIALMSVDYSRQLSKQDLADIVAFLAMIGASAQ